MENEVLHAAQLAGNGLGLTLHCWLLISMSLTLPTKT